MSRQIARAALRETKKQFAHNEKLAKRRAARESLQAKRRKKPKSRIESFDGLPAVARKRDSGYVKIGRLFRP